jgi:hypothetical protein
MIMASVLAATLLSSTAAGEPQLEKPKPPAVKVEAPEATTSEQKQRTPKKRALPSLIRKISPKPGTTEQTQEPPAPARTSPAGATRSQPSGSPGSVRIRVSEPLTMTGIGNFAPSNFQPVRVEVGTPLTFTGVGETTSGAYEAIRVEVTTPLTMTGMGGE